MQKYYDKLAKSLCNRPRTNLWKSEFSESYPLQLVETWKKLGEKNISKSAAVLVPLFEKNDAIHLLLTRRTDTVEHHKGEISFPGGARDSNDRNLLETALRETSEEIGIPKESVNVLGILDDAFTFVSKFVVTPYLAYIPYPYSSCLNYDETQEILEVPLDFFLYKKNFWTNSFFYQGHKIESYFFQWNPDIVIWGLTAFIIKNVCDVISLMNE